MGRICGTSGGGIRDFYGETQRNETSVEDLGMYGRIKCKKNRMEGRELV